MKNITVLFGCLLLCVSLPSLVLAQHEAASVKEEIYIPKDLDECFKELNKLLNKEDVEKIRSGEVEAIEMHFGLGMGFRNSWGLWKGSRLAKYFNELGVSHPDDMSGVILESYTRHLKGQPIEIEEQIRRYREFWAEIEEVEVEQDVQTKDNTE